MLPVTGDCTSYLHVIRNADSLSTSEMEQMICAMLDSYTGDLNPRHWIYHTLDSFLVRRRDISLDFLKALYRMVVKPEPDGFPGLGPAILAHPCMTDIRWFNEHATSDNLMSMLIYTHYPHLASICGPGLFGRLVEGTRDYSPARMALVISLPGERPVPVSVPSFYQVFSTVLRSPLQSPEAFGPLSRDLMMLKSSLFYYDHYRASYLFRALAARPDIDPAVYESLLGEQDGLVWLWALSNPLLGRERALGCIAQILHGQGSWPCHTPGSWPWDTAVSVIRHLARSPVLSPEDFALLTLVDDPAIKEAAFEAVNSAGNKEVR